MSLHFFRTKIEHYQDLILDGKHTEAALEMEQYLQDGIQEKSDVAALMQLVSDYDGNIQQAIAMLREGVPIEASKKLEGMKEILNQLKVRCELIAKEEEKGLE